MKLRGPVALSVFIVATSVLAQQQPLSICIVQTKPDAATQYQYTAGPYTIAMYNQLTGERLQNDTPLRVIGLAASVQHDILPEARRLHGSWILQLWHHGTNERDVAMGDQDSLLFTIWNGDTRKVIARGSGATMRETQGDTSQVQNPGLYAALARQILKKLNQTP